jgi:hypothetical protein
MTRRRSGEFEISSPAFVVQSGKRKTLDHRPKCQWPKWMTAWVSDPNIIDLTQRGKLLTGLSVPPWIMEWTNADDYTLLHIHIRQMTWSLQIYSLQQIYISFQLFITWLKTLKQNIKTTGDPGKTLQESSTEIVHKFGMQCVQPPNHMWVFREEKSL